ncbi:TPA: hypothetical protein N0F65_000024, partial [Lagenidium giganteum]
VRLPQTSTEWQAILEGFEDIAGVPYVCGAIDCTLINVPRFADWEGWYCREGFPAFNVQAVVDHNKRFMAYSIRPGSSNDKAVFNMSSFGQHVHKQIPKGCFFVGDAGYQFYIQSERT